MDEIGLQVMTTFSVLKLTKRQINILEIILESEYFILILCGDKFQSYIHVMFSNW